MKPERLKKGDTIGIIAPCFRLTPESIENSVRNLEEKGFRVKLSKNIFSASHGYAASPGERAEDFNAMIADTEVKMLLFGGGEVSNELLPLIDYEAVKRNSKIICSYSDSTTLLEAIYANTGLVTFYGASLRTFANPTEYNLGCFNDRLTRTDKPDFERNSEWRTISSGTCEGTLIGGYLLNFAMLLGGEYFSYDRNKKYILFLEDHIKFNIPAAVARYFAHIEQSGFFSQVTGLLWGHYSPDESPEIDRILKRTGDRYGFPVVRCEDYGHGENNAVLPIGIRGVLDADAHTLRLLESGVI